MCYHSWKINNIGINQIMLLWNLGSLSYALTSQLQPSPPHPGMCTGDVGHMHAQAQPTPSWWAYMHIGDKPKQWDRVSTSRGPHYVPLLPPPRLHLVLGQPASGAPAEGVAGCGCSWKPLPSAHKGQQARRGQWFPAAAAPQDEPPAHSPETRGPHRHYSREWCPAGHAPRPRPVSRHHPGHVSQFYVLQ